ncbi:glucosamine-6-phosphate deaminase [Geomicrobium sp. JSM 1781026]|uniref:glucosamine-6-phosphate deaminase n=1 Tax=Geomicrobium sp. JSM 1781026 TaxID=3344580 RepID=UPI0035C0DD69
MNVYVMKDYEEMSGAAAEQIAKKMLHNPKIVLGLATGGTPEGMYRYLVEKYYRRELSFQHATTFNLDEYIGLNDDHPLSYHAYMKKHLFDHVDVRTDHTHLPNGKARDIEQECLNYEQQIQLSGGIDLQILGLGHNGHIGFNEPNTSFDSRTHRIELDEQTREANARYFDTLEEVPSEAITMGISTILEAKEILVLVSGADKAEAVRKMISEAPNPNHPATVLQNHPKVTLFIDEAAAVELDESMATK